MKIAFLSDIHGNMPALQTCLKAVAEHGCDKIYCLGDTFGYFQDGQGCYEQLSRLGTEFLAGNHEAMLLGKLQIGNRRDDVYQLSAEGACLSLEARNALGRLLPYKLVTLVTGKRLLLVHGSPWDPLQGYVYPDTDLRDYGSLPYDYIFMGHTHRPFIRREAETYIVNTGSCGLPRDIGNMASFAVYDCTLDRVELVRPRLDIGAIEKKYPTAHPSVLRCLRRRSP